MQFDFFALDVQNTKDIEVRSSDGFPRLLIHPKLLQRSRESSKKPPDFCTHRLLSLFECLKTTEKRFHVFENVASRGNTRWLLYVHLRKEFRLTNDVDTQQQHISTA